MCMSLEAEKLIMKKRLCACFPVGGNWGKEDSGGGGSIVDMVGGGQTGQVSGLSAGGSPAG